MLNHVTMKANEDPVKLFEQLSEIESMYNTNDMTVDEADLIAVVFMVAPEQYQSVIASVQLEKCDELTLYDLEDSMNQVWRQKNAASKKTAEDASEIALSAVSGKKCWNCGETGHITKNCPKKGGGKGRGNNSNNNNSGKTCSMCGKQGHEEKDCWSNPKNAGK